MPAIIQKIRNNVANGIPLNIIKNLVKEESPNYNINYVEMVWVEHQAKLNKTVQEIEELILKNIDSFEMKWTQKKIQKFIDKLNNPQVKKIRIDPNVTPFDEERTFGVEIEFLRPISLSHNKICNVMIRDVGIEVFQDARMTPNSNFWKLTNDGSVKASFYDSNLQGQNELVSPILKGKTGLEEVKKVLTVLKNLGCKVNPTCGLHVHHGFKTKDLSVISKTIRNTCLLYHQYRNKIAKMLPKDRRSNIFCKNLRRNELQNLVQDYNKTERLDGLYEPSSRHHAYRQRSRDGKKHLMFLDFTKTRRKVVNVYSYLQHETLEFRQHSGTLDYIKAVNWIILTQRFINTADEYTQKQINLLAHNYRNIHVELGLKDDLNSYIQQRWEEMKNATCEPC